MGNQPTHNSTPVGGRKPDVSSLSQFQSGPHTSSSVATGNVSACSPDDELGKSLDQRLARGLIVTKREPSTDGKIRITYRCNG